MARSMDLTQGSVFKKLLVFAFPLLLTNLMQQFYHAADVIVVGNFAQDSTTSLAAVGSTGSITTLLLNLFLGLSVGANVICANRYGARDAEGLRRAMHTSILVSAISGVFIGAVGFFLAKPLLLMMGSPDTVIDAATTYMKIIFLGQPASLLYNFGAGILRAHGDTKRPMYILLSAGVVNVVLNLVFVIVFHLDSTGVALATIVAHYLSAAAILYILFSPHSETQMNWKELRLHLSELKKIAAIGIPSGINGMVFSLSNVIIVSRVNSFGDVVIAGNSAATSVDAFVYTVIAAFYSACIAFSGQNAGAKQYKRIDRLVLSSCVIVISLLVVINLFLTLFPEFFMGLFTDKPEVIAAGTPRMIILGWGYILYSVSEIALGSSRGMGKSFGPTLLNMFFICIPRILWVYFIFPLNPIHTFLYWCYPVSWLLSGIAQVTYYILFRRKIDRSVATEQKAQPVLNEA